MEARIAEGRLVDAVADEITTSNDEDGVALVLEQVLDRDWSHPAASA